MKVTSQSPSLKQTVKQQKSTSENTKTDGQSTKQTQGNATHKNNNIQAYIPSLLSECQNSVISNTILTLIHFQPGHMLLTA